MLIGKDYIIEALKFHLLDIDERAAVKSIRTTPRKAPSQKVNNMSYVLLLVWNAVFDQPQGRWWGDLSQIKVTYDRDTAVDTTTNLQLFRMMLAVFTQPPLWWYSGSPKSPPRLNRP